MVHVPQKRFEYDGNTQTPTGSTSGKTHSRASFDPIIPQCRLLTSAHGPSYNERRLFTSFFDHLRQYHFLSTMRKQITSGIGMTARRGDFLPPKTGKQRKTCANCYGIVITVQVWYMFFTVPYRTVPYHTCFRASGVPYRTLRYVLYRTVHNATVPVILH